MVVVIVAQKQKETVRGESMDMMNYESNEYRYRIEISPSSSTTVDSGAPRYIANRPIRCFSSINQRQPVLVLLLWQKNLHALAVGILKEKPQQNITNRYYKDTEL